MFVIAHHFISQPEEFWAAAQQVTAAIPAFLKLHAIFPSKDLKTGTCIWEGPGVKPVQEFLDNATGSMAKNVCYEVKEEIALGLPQKKMAEAVSA